VAGGPAWTIRNESGTNCQVTLKGMLVDPATVFGTVVMDGFGLTTNVNVLAEGNRTQQWQFVNGLLKAVVPQ
jgi:hypothetical protein